MWHGIQTVHWLQLHSAVARLKFSIGEPPNWFSCTMSIWRRSIRLHSIPAEMLWSPAAMMGRQKFWICLRDVQFTHWLAMMMLLQPLPFRAMATILPQQAETNRYEISRLPPKELISLIFDFDFLHLDYAVEIEHRRSQREWGIITAKHGKRS